MAIEIRIPKLGLTMEEADLVKWTKETGDSVAAEEIILVIETDKVTFEMPAPGAGLLVQTIAAGNKVVVDELVGYLAADEAELASLSDGAAAPAAPAAEAAPAEEKAAAPAASPAATGGAPAGRIFASPLAKAMAKEHDLDLSLISGSGPNGRIVKADVLKAIEQGVAAPAPAAEAAAPAAPAADDIMAVAEEIPISGVRKAIFKNMHQSLADQAQLTIHTEADATNLKAIRKSLNELGDGTKISFNAILIKAAAMALRQHPHVNASVAGDVIKVWKNVHIGLAVDLGGGLIVPKIRYADSKPVKAISAEIAALVEKAQAGGLMPDDLAGGTFTITNLGAWDIDHFTPIVNNPESAILGLGRIVDKAVVKNGKVVAAPMIALSLSFDHRIVDGAPAAAFLKTIKDMIEQPLLML